MSTGEATQRDLGRLGLVAAVAGWVIAFLPAVVPAAFKLWCLGLVLGLLSV